MLRSALVLTVCFSQVCSYPQFSEQLPNGNSVPHPCEPSTSWVGVGHESDVGNGPLNVFGRDFRKQGLVWNKALCDLDSDGDGKSNGEELGDPLCLWTPGNPVNVTIPSKLSHPGVCEPLTTPACQEKNAFLATSRRCARFFNKTDWCPAINRPGVKKLKLRFKETVVPVNDTSYMCQEFFLPSDQDYEIIAWEPFISNVEIMHHMLSYACARPDEIMRYKMMGKDHYKDPVICPMMPACTSYSMVWAFGVPSRCYSDDRAIPFGKNFYNTTILQIHYNNPKMRNYYKDSSGVVIYYQVKQRPNAVGSFVVGNMEVILPPRRNLAVIAAEGFKGACSEKILGNRTYYIQSMLFHMHQLGNYGKLVLKKKSGEIITLVDRVIDYDMPAMVQYPGNGTLALQAGDALSIECRYSTITRRRTVLFGESTRDEMCLGIFEVYPWINNMLGAGALDIGEFDTCTMREAMTLKNCSRLAFRALTNMTRTNNLGTIERECSCTPGLYPVPACSRKCYNFLSKNGFLTMPQCLQGSIVHLLGIAPGDWTTQYAVRGQLEKCVKLTAPPPEGQTCDVRPSGR